MRFGVRCAFRATGIDRQEPTCKGYDLGISFERIGHTMTVRFLVEGGQHVQQEFCMAYSTSGCKCPSSCLISKFQIVMQTMLFEGLSI